jgi:hypothetical protein
MGTAKGAQLTEMLVIHAHETWEYLHEDATTSRSTSETTTLSTQSEQDNIMPHSGIDKETTEPTNK